MRTPRGLQKVILEAQKHHIPLDVCLELTHRCNFRCQHCYIPDFAVPNLLTTERILKLLEELRAAGTLFLTLSGGEMFLRQDWYLIAQRARALGFYLRLFTNASLITQEIAQQVAALPAAVEVSLYSMDEKVFEEVTKSPGSFRKTIRGIELLRSEGVEVLLKVPITTINYGSYAEVFAYAQKIGAECRADTKIVHRKDGNLAPLRLRVPEEQLLPFYRGPSTGCALVEEAEGSAQTEGPLCAAAVRFCNITATGDVLACTILPGSGGNVREKPFREIWESSLWLNKIRHLRRKDLKVCSTCSKFHYCGRCLAQALVEDGDLTGPSSWACAHAEALERAAQETQDA